MAVRLKAVAITIVNSFQVSKEMTPTKGYQWLWYESSPIAVKSHDITAARDLAAV